MIVTLEDTIYVLLFYAITVQQLSDSLMSLCDDNSSSEFSMAQRVSQASLWSKA